MICGVIELSISIPVENDFYSTSNLMGFRTTDYKLDETQINNIYNSLSNWIKGLSEIQGADRPIPLPYIVDSVDLNTPTRTETITRRGNIIGSNQTTLSEYSFWNYFVPSILKTYYSNTITETTNYDSDIWKAATALIMDIYALVKPGICDSILDSNNNIVNFSTEMEIPILINKVTVKYQPND